MNGHEDYLKYQAQGLSTTDLMSLLQQDQVIQWKGELPLKVEDYLRLFPTLQEDVENILVLIMGEVIQRETQGQEIDDKVYFQRFPHLHEQLKLQLEFHRALGQTTVAMQGTSPSGSSAKSSSLIGKLIADKFLLRECIGEGGMGTVWRAEQLTPVKRQVAVKLIKTGLDTRTVMARFEAERQALAIMDHPNIAKVLDGGVTSANEPYFVMELVKGVSITQYSDHNKLSIRHRLELFLPVCSAIQHAHQKGIIHRDIKPSNVLVALYDLKPVPKVIDFGVAKAIHAPLTDATLETGMGNVIGTPEYMSPEQASLNNLDIDTRTDVYSLGVLLYELLTGNPPFRSEDYRQSGLLEMLRVIRDEEPPRPSDRISTSKLLATISVNRAADSKKLVGSLRNDLDLIVMKAMEKERSRRYDSAASLAADLQRYLVGEPVNAHPPSSWYRLRKIVLKRKGTVLAASLLVLSLLAGTVGTTWGYFLAESRREEADQARSNETAQRVLAEQHAEAATQAAKVAEAAKELEAQQRERAEKAWERALQALDAMTSNLASESMLSQQNLTPQQRQFLNEVVKYYQEFANSKPDDPGANRIVARAFFGLGMVQYNLDQRTEAVKNIRSSLQISRTLLQAEPGKRIYRDQFGRTLHLLGVMLQELSNYEEAKKLFDESLEVHIKLSTDYPTDPNYIVVLGVEYTNLGVLSTRMGLSAEAIVYIKKSIPMWNKLLERNPGHSVHLADLAQTYHVLGIAQFYNKKQSEAGDSFKQAIQLREQLLKLNPTSRNARRAMATSYSSLGGILKKPLDAQEYLLKALPLEEALVKDFPHSLAYQLSLAGTFCNIGHVHFKLHELKTALACYGKAEELLKSILAKQPDMVDARQYYCNTCWERAKLHVSSNHHTEALNDYDKLLKFPSDSRKYIFRLGRAKSLMATHAYQATFLEVKELSKLAKWDPQNWYDLARLSCLAGTAMKDQATEYPELTVSLLKRAIESGFTDRAKLSSDVAFQSLSDRPEFKELVKSIPQR